MRRSRRLVAVVGAAGVVAAAMAAPAVGAQPSRSATKAAQTAPQVRTQQHTVTLITGDTVTVTTGPDGKYAVEVQRAPGPRVGRSS
ncbi:hypothetical protein SSOG_01811 [Streptomyces himastatinicus ATCC 53653]|uniref:Secreted protein n=1 Tax=Streptomyces himastatinicus ATCC 53653 TaxID=457427 RepID=D9WSF8_9ACTN|nr:hypothetical protein [Streptomyces himastatinicus]EFL22099.1 hypothetical protein SSOG_01811 [Streptomyces himastatinicus ATCC 53653]